MRFLTGLLEMKPYGREHGKKVEINPKKKGKIVGTWEIIVPRKKPARMKAKRQLAKYKRRTK